MHLLNNYEACKADAVLNKPFDLLFLLKKIRMLAPHNIGKIITNNRIESVHLSSLINQTTIDQKKYPC